MGYGNIERKKKQRDKENVVKNSENYIFLAA